MIGLLLVRYRFIFQNHKKEVFATYTSVGIPIFLIYSPVFYRLFYSFKHCSYKLACQFISQHHCSLFCVDIHSMYCLPTYLHNAKFYCRLLMLNRHRILILGQHFKTLVAFEIAANGYCCAVGLPMKYAMCALYRLLFTSVLDYRTIDTLCGIDKCTK